MEESKEVQEKIDKAFPKALELIKAKKLFFHSDVHSYLGISHDTYYRWFPKGSDKSEAIKEEMNKQRMDIKVSLRAQFHTKGSPAERIALYKLIGTDEERKKISQTYQDVTSKGESIKPLSECSDEELTERARQLADKVNGAE